MDSLELDVSRKTLHLNPRYVVLHLNDLAFVNHNGLWYLDLRRDGKMQSYHIGKSFKDSFLKTFNMSRKLAENIPLDALLKAAQDHDGKRVKVYLNDACALAVSMMKETEDPLSPLDVQEVVEILEQKGYDVQDVKYGDLVSEFVVFNATPFKPFNSKHGVYRAGGLFNIPHDKGSTVRAVAVLEHCSSHNYAIINSRPLSLCIPQSKNAEKTFSELKDAALLIARAKKPEFHDLLVDALKTAKNTVASVNECVYAAGRIMDFGHRLKANLVRLSKLLDYYGMASPAEKPQKWLESTPSHANRLQLFHLLVGLRVCEPREYREEVGDFLFTGGDLFGANLARIWRKKPKVTMEDTDPFENDDSDIISDYTSDETESMTEYDEDDIHSDLGDE